MKKIYVVLFLLCISFSGIAQSASNDSVLRPSTPVYTYQQTESINVFYDAINNELVIENNTKQMHNFTIGIYNLTGTIVLETKSECLIGKSVDIHVELNPGLYIVNIIDKPIVLTKKVIIK